MPKTETKTKKPTQRLNFSRRTLDSLPDPPAGEKLTVFDTETRGLGLVKFSSGIRTFFHLRFVRGYPQRTTLDRYPDISVEQARAKAEERNGKLAEWKLSGFKARDPFENTGDPTFGELIRQYVEKHIMDRARRPEKAAKRIERQTGNYLASWRNRKAGSLQKRDVVELHERIGQDHGKFQANRIVQLVRAVFYWAEEAGIWHGENPGASVKLFHEAKRTRFVQPAEMPTLFAALQTEKNKDFVDFVHLALWCGARKSDILSMRWQDLSLEDNRWNVPFPKGGESYQIALTPEAVEILQRRNRERTDETWVFPSWSACGHVVDYKRAWHLLLKRTGLENLRQHDMRRTLGSWQAGLNTSLGIIGKSLGHKSLAATEIYGQLILDPVRESVNAATRAMIAASKTKPKLLTVGKSKAAGSRP
jgi:integrase